MTGEIWKPVVGYEGIYEVSNMGRVRSLERKVLHSHGSLRIQNPRVLKPCKAGRGYLFVGLYNAEGRKLKTIHHLVATAFLPPSEKPDVNHKDFNKSNNAALNLEWCTSMENSHHHQIGEPGLTAAEASARMRAVTMADQSPHQNYDDANRWLKVPVSELTTPKPGRMCHGPRWWAVIDDGGVKCALFFQGGNRGRGNQYCSPQCNDNKAVLSRLRPDCEAVFIEMTFIPYNQWEYED